MSHYYQIINSVRYRHIYLLIRTHTFLISATDLHHKWLFTPADIMFNILFFKPLKMERERERGRQVEHRYFNLKTTHYNI